MCDPINRTHRLTDPTQPPHVEKFGPNPPQPTTTNNSTAWCNQILSNRALNPLTQSFQFFSTFAIVDPTHQKLKNLDPTLPNPWVNPTHEQFRFELTERRVNPVRRLAEKSTSVLARPEVVQRPPLLLLPVVRDSTVSLAELSRSFQTHRHR